MLSPALAALSETDLSQIKAAPAADAVLPPLLLLQGENGEAKPLRQWLGSTPSIWILADYTCETLCGPVISIVSDALERTGLRPGLDFRLIVAGLDPKDTAADAATMKRAQVGSGNNFARETFFLRATAKTVSELTKTFGFHSVYDREHDQFAHPAVAYVVTPAGHVARVLSGLGLDPTDLRLALVDAGQGRVGSWTDHVRLLCYGFDPSRGAYTAAIGRLLSGAGVLTIIVLGLFILALFRRERALRPE
jgi:protein SCO1/2